MVETLIFSKDRPMQLDLLCRSLKRNLPDLQKIHCLYKATTKDFSKGYDILMKRFPHIDFIEEKDFVVDTKRIVASFTERHSLCLVDDSVAINSIDLLPTLSILNSPDVHCLSLRLSPRLTYTYPTSTENRLPKFDRCNVAGTILQKWEWGRAKSNTDYQYPSCIDGHVYMSAFFKFFVAEADFKSVNNLEECIDASRQHFRPAMVCFENTIILTIPNNLVQTTNRNRSGKNLDNTVESLNQKYLDGFIIDASEIYGYENKACHEEIPFSFIKEK